MKTGGKFGKDERKDLLKSDTPGPGTYSVVGVVGKEGCNYSIRNKYKKDPQIRNRDIPGPG